ncbi:MAG: efflux RND transporter periplasmic adaptor subunit [Caulobacterales bacterium]
MSKPPNWKLLGGLAVVAVVALGGAAYWFTHRAPAVRYVTAPVTRGDVQTTITASGSVNPVVTVQVGTYVSGAIQALYCDYNTRVRRGQLCAKIDPQPYSVVVEQDQADLAVAKAQLLKDQANVAYTRLANGRQALLLGEDSTSRDAADAALNAYSQANALVRLDTATIAQRTALLKAAQVNLNYTNIVSPVDGTVVSRNVNVGQTVAASFSTPTLFLIATDLTKMQVDTNVSESDIAGATPGAGASFTVDAFPNQTFRGTVTQVRQAPISVQNVITYDVVIAVGNPRLQLKPGMTATARIVTSQARGVLRVPSQALRFTPAGAARAAGGKGAAPGRRVVWVQRGGKLVSVPVTVGLDDDSFAEIRSGALQVGDQVVTGQAAAGAPRKSQASATPTLKL